MVFFFNDTATTEIYTLSLHDALPIWLRQLPVHPQGRGEPAQERTQRGRCPDGSPGRRSRRSQGQRRSLRNPLRARGDRKSTRLNSSHANISYAVFCLKKKQKNNGDRP